MIPSSPCSDQLVWTDSESGMLSFKEAYVHNNPIGQVVPWAKLIWNNSVPPSKSFILWRITHNKMTTDENLHCIGCIVVSMCSQCGNSYETTKHLFLDCPFAKDLWQWFMSAINCFIDLSSFDAVISLCHRGWSPQIQDMIISGILNILYAIWRCRNLARFDNKKVPVSTAITLISSNISLTGIHSKRAMSNSIMEFSMLKFFHVQGHPSTAPRIT